VEAEMENGKLVIVAVVFVRNPNGEENPNPVVIGPFKNREECFNWEKKNRSDKGISRIEVKNVIPL
jgi:hypothetical protein